MKNQKMEMWQNKLRNLFYPTEGKNPVYKKSAFKLDIKFKVKVTWNILFGSLLFKKFYI